MKNLLIDLIYELNKNNAYGSSKRILKGRTVSTLRNKYDNFRDLNDPFSQNNQTIKLVIEKYCKIKLREQVTVDSTAFVAQGGPEGVYSKH